MRLLLIGSLLVVCAGPARAGSLHDYTFAGTLQTRVGAGDGLTMGVPDEFGPAAIGAPFSGQLTVEDGFPDLNPDQKLGEYPSALVALSVDYAGHTYALDGMNPLPGTGMFVDIGNGVQFSPYRDDIIQANAPLGVAPKDVVHGTP